jgi:hypothetical protein
MDVYVLRWAPHLGGNIIGIFARREGASARMADFTAIQQGDLRIENFDVQDGE